ncbi:MAG: DUF3098 domain-containing protein [Thermonemataceae bacterium]
MAKTKLKKNNPTTSSTVKKGMPASNDTRKVPYALEEQNYFIMLVGIGLILLGFIVMASDKEPYGFGFLGLTLGPIILFLGFMVQIAAILYKPSSKK